MPLSAIAYSDWEGSMVKKKSVDKVLKEARSGDSNAMSLARRMADKPGHPNREDAAKAVEEGAKAKESKS